MKLGRLKSPHDSRTLWLSNYLTRLVRLPAPLTERDWGKGIADWQMFANDEVGDCVVAAAAHLDMQWERNAGRESNITTLDVVRAYSEVSGYDPKDPNTDQGTDPLTFLKYWRKTGIAGHRIGAYLRVNAEKPQQLVYAINEFEGVFMALGLPLAVQGSKLWDIPEGKRPTGAWEPWSWGGHMVESPQYDAAGCPCVTWGAITPMTWRFAATYSDECYCVLSDDMLNKEGVSPLGFDLEQLRKDLEEVGNA